MKELMDRIGVFLMMLFLHSAGFTTLLSAFLKADINDALLVMAAGVVVAGLALAGVEGAELSAIAE